MFDGPEHASYIALMRTRPLGRPIEYGDWFWWPGDDEFVEAAVYCYDGFAAGDGMAPDPVRGGILLPRLDQWLHKLHETGHHLITICPMGDHGIRVAWDHPNGYAVTAATAEEAAARLWMAVAGRPVTG